MSDEYETEPIPGLPGYLPAGEAILWQGSPVWTSIARHVFHAVPVALYFTALIGWRFVTAYSDGTDMSGPIAPALWIAVAGAACLGLIVLLSRLTARTTIYTITNKRLVMRYGIAMPMCVNLPFTQIMSAGLHTYGDTTGDVALTINSDGRLAYFHLWPHARPWHVNQTQPMMRALADPAAVANVLTKALANVHPTAERTMASQTSLAPEENFGAMGSAVGAA